ncbi:MAG: metallophosphoesterase [Bacteriovoracia bacterium]
MKTSKGFHFIGLALVAGAATAFADIPAEDGKVITFLHTNDLHSHFRPHGDVLMLGGVARLKTQIDRLRAEAPRSFLVDGGDWSEGYIYYNFGAGLESMRMLDRLGYDAAVIGNHDWLNGPDWLLDLAGILKPKTKFLGANLSLAKFDQAERFRENFLPYVIQEKDGIKVAFIGVLTYELIYDKYFRPVRIESPFTIIRDLAERLSHEVDMVVAVSHNSLGTNHKLLRAAPALDLIIGGHDHVKLLAPIKVERDGTTPGYVVEAGKHGEYLGRIDFHVTPGQRPAYVSHGLYQIDARIPESDEIAGVVEEVEARLEGKFGPIFHDHVADSELYGYVQGAESLAGNLTTDAYRAFTGADVALDQANFIHAPLPRGSVTTADTINMLPTVFHAKTERTWTVKTLPIRGDLLQSLLNVLFASSFSATSGQVSMSGIEVRYSQGKYPGNLSPTLALIFGALDPITTINHDPKAALPTATHLTDVRVGGRPIKHSRVYTLAASQNIFEAINFVNSVVPSLVPTAGLVDTDMEAWRVLRQHLQKSQRVTRDNLAVGKRVRSEQPDLAVTVNDIEWQPHGPQATTWNQIGVRASLRIKVFNFGLEASARSGRELEILGSLTGGNLAVETQFVALSGQIPLPSIAPGASTEVALDVVLPGDSEFGLYPLTARITGGVDEINHTNDEATRWFRYPVE